MLPLDDPRWREYIGGYREPYDASDALKRLLDGPDSVGALEELDDELCHQGDLGSASYASLPWILEYLRRRPDLDARAVGLVLTIEFGRPFNREQVPDEVRKGYDRALGLLSDVVLSKRGGQWDDRQTQVAAAVLALGQGNAWFARTYCELDRSMLDHLLKKEFGAAEWGWP